MWWLIALNQESICGVFVDFLDTRRNMSFFITFDVFAYMSIINMPYFMLVLGLYGIGNNKIKDWIILSTGLGESKYYTINALHNYLALICNREI